MSDVFLSYSRRDQAVVRRLHAALAETGREAWVDWEGIPPTAEWMAEVRAAVDAADAFVVILSPDWAASPVCREEAEHAASRGKRIVPVVVRDTDPASVPERVAALNWIFLRAGDDFGGGVATLLAALDLDLDWVHGHTRLLARAGEWEARGHERSLLLRGRDLQAAEALLAGAGANRDPQPTPLQAEYLYAARQAERRSGRIRTAGLAGGLVVALGLAAFAMVQLFRAEDQTRVANDQARLAQARELAAAADGQLTTDPELSVLLAREAVDRWTDPGTDRSLRQALEASPIRARYIGHQSEVRTVDLTADGSRMVSCSMDDGTVRLWDTATHQAIRVLKTEHGVPMAADISPDGSLIVAGTWDGWIEAWDGATGEPIRAWQAHAKPILDVTFSPDGRRLLSAGDDGAARLWDVATWRLALSVPDVPEGSMRNGAFAPDGRTFVTGNSDRRARTWDATTGVLLATFVGHTRTVEGVAVSADGQHIATAGADETVRVWDAATGIQTAIMRGNDQGVSAVAFAPDGRMLASAGWDGTVRTWDVATGRQLKILTGHKGLVSDLTFDASGRSLTTAGRDGTIRTWALEPFDVIADYPGHAIAVIDGDISPDGTRVLTVSGDWTAMIHDRWSGESLVTLRGHEFAVVTGRYSPDGTQVVTASWDGTARTWDAATGQARLVLGSGDLGMNEAAWSPDGRWIATAGSDGTARTWDAADGTPGLTIDVGSPVGAVRFSTDGSLIVAGDESGQVSEWDAVTGARVRSWRAQQYQVIALAIDPMRPRIATLGGEGAISIWDQATGTLQLGLKPAYGYGWRIAFSADGTRVATGGDDGAAHVWDSDSGELLADIPADPRDVESVTFSDNGEDLLLTSRSSAKLVHCDLCGSATDVRTLADARVTRALAPAERVRWLHETPVAAPTNAPSGSPAPGGSPVLTASPSPVPPPESPPPTLAPGTICQSDQPCPIPAGHYRSVVFRPGLSFDLPIALAALESRGTIGMPFDDGDDIGLLNAQDALGQVGDSAIVVGASSDEWLAYLRSNPALQLGPIANLTVDGHAAKGVTITSDTTDRFNVALTDSVEWNWSTGETMRLTVVDVDGGGLIILGDHLPGTPIDEFDATFDALVSSIRLTGDSSAPSASAAP